MKSLLWFCLEAAPPPQLGAVQFLRSAASGRIQYPAPASLVTLVRCVSCCNTFTPRLPVLGICKDALIKVPLATEHHSTSLHLFFPLQRTRHFPALPASLQWKGSQRPCFQLRTQGPSSASPSLTSCSRVLVPRAATCSLV